MILFKLVQWISISKVCSLCQGEWANWRLFHRQWVPCPGRKTHPEVRPGDRSWGFSWRTETSTASSSWLYFILKWSLHIFHVDVTLRTTARCCWFWWLEPVTRYEELTLSLMRGPLKWLSYMLSMTRSISLIYAHHESHHESHES